LINNDSINGERRFQSALPISGLGAHDSRLVSPQSGQDLLFTEDALVTADGNERYSIESGILRLFLEEQVAGAEGRNRDAITRTVQTFYEETPFPNYNDFDTLESFVQRAVEGVFANLLSQQIPINAKVLEVGCGTGQLSNYLAATTMAHIYAADMSIASLRLGQEFAARHDIPGITYLQMNLFRPPIRPDSMDIVISNGVLHHTADTRRAFLSIGRLVKPGGHIIIGLYNRIGRLRTVVRRKLYTLFGEKVLALDPYLRGNLAAEKRRAWIKDQYFHPQERSHTLSEVLGWFQQAGFAFVSSIPKICGQLSAKERLFEPQNPGSPIERFGAELEMIFSHGGEGGLFIIIGRRR
jgi:SAM-dependent methyltransferase